ncbi:MAG: amidohydrolase family protein [Bryobacteraceae bacterium]|nr:amidohydrolase family protein [Bryobacteraceae bacterium]
MNRRAFLSTAAIAAVSTEAQPVRPGVPVIDTHIHLFDTTRSQGVPWPPKDNTALYRPALPPRYRKLSAEHGIVGAIKVEASPWLEDNQWVLDLAAKETLIVGMVGNIEPSKPGFAANLERFHKNPLFLGIRYGNLWGSDLAVTSTNKAVITDLRSLAQTGLSLDTANPTPALVAAIVRVTDEVPELRVIIDHLPQLTEPESPSERMAYRGYLAELHKRPQVFVKVSQIYRKVKEGTIPRDLGVYRANLDRIFETFGEDRVLFGSDWPNSDNWRPYSDIFSIAQEYIRTKGPEVAEKYFWKNSVRAYRWKPRNASQPTDPPKTKI